jgi:hypothetical protein
VVKSSRKWTTLTDCSAEKEFVFALFVLFVVKEILTRMADINQKLKAEIGKAEMDRIWRRS